MQKLYHAVLTCTDVLEYQECNVVLEYRKALEKPTLALRVKLLPAQCSYFFSVNAIPDSLRILVGMVETVASLAKSY